MLVKKINQHKCNICKNVAEYYIYSTSEYLCEKHFKNKYSHDPIKILYEESKIPVRERHPEDFFVQKGFKSFREFGKKESPIKKRELNSANVVNILLAYENGEWGEFTSRDNKKFMTISWGKWYYIFTDSGTPLSVIDTTTHDSIQFYNYPTVDNLYSLLDKMEA